VTRSARVDHRGHVAPRIGLVARREPQVARVHDLAMEVPLAVPRLEVLVPCHVAVGVGDLGHLAVGVVLELGAHALGPRNRRWQAGGGPGVGGDRAARVGDGRGEVGAGVVGRGCRERPARAVGAARAGGDVHLGEVAAAPPAGSCLVGVGRHPAERFGGARDQAFGVVGHRGRGGRRVGQLRRMAVGVVLVGPGVEPAIGHCGSAGREVVGDREQIPAPGLLGDLVGPAVARGVGVGEIEPVDAPGVGDRGQVVALGELAGEVAGGGLVGVGRGQAVREGRLPHRHGRRGDRGEAAVQVVGVLHLSPVEVRELGQAAVRVVLKVVVPVEGVDDLHQPSRRVVAEAHLVAGGLGAAGAVGVSDGVRDRDQAPGPVEAHLVLVGTDPDPAGRGLGQDDEAARRALVGALASIVDLEGLPPPPSVVVLDVSIRPDASHPPEEEVPRCGFWTYDRFAGRGFREIFRYPPDAVFRIEAERLERGRGGQQEAQDRREDGAEPSLLSRFRGHRGSVAAKEKRLSARGSSEAELLADQLRKRVLDLGVAGDGRLLAVGGVDVEVVLLAVTMELAAGAPELLEKRPALHTSTSISLSWAFARRVAASSSRTSS